MFRRSIRISLASLYVLLCVPATSLRAADDPKEIVRRALRINARNRELERSYTYLQRDEERTLDSSGAVKRRESKTWDVVPLQGAQFRRLIERDDKPLSPKEEQQQEAARQKREAARRKTAELRARETPEQRQKDRDRAPVEFGSSDDFMLQQALNKLQGKPVLESKALLERRLAQSDPPQSQGEAVEH